MFFVLKVLAFMAFLITFTNYHYELFEFTEFYHLQVYVLPIITLYHTLATQPQQGTEYLFENEDTAIDETATVILSSGSQIRGQKYTQSTAFYNIRYAQPPINDLRFADPVPYEQPDFVDATTQQRIFCPQVSTFTDEVTEDCLYLTVYVPSGYVLDESTDQQLPVMFWIHGGAFTVGSGSEKLYDAGHISNITNTIIVTSNYRLGWLGFLPYEKGGITGNQGLKDNRLAMKWVYDNIASFGGDNNKITLFGESAGGQAVMFHLLSDESSPYYQRAIVQSPFAFPYQNSQEWNTIADLVVTQFKLRFKCHMLSGLDCLRQLPQEEFLVLNNGTSNIAQSLIGARSHFAPLATESEFPIFDEGNTPMIDGQEFTSNPLELFETGQWATEKDVIIGHTNGELLFLPDMENPFTKQFIEDKARVVFGEYLGHAAVSTYEELQPGTEYNEMFGNIMTDAFFSCYSRALANNMAKTSTGNVFAYEFAQSFQTRDAESGELIVPKAMHGGELTYLFRGGLDDLGYKGTDGDRQVMEMMSDYWGSFAWDGFPSSATYSEWPAYMSESNGEMKTLRISHPDATVLTNLNEDVCNFWDISGQYDRA